MSERVPANKTRKQPGVPRDQSTEIQVEGSPDTDRVLAVLEWLVYRRGPLARSMRKSG